jgi:hypothetical protein
MTGEANDEDAKGTMPGSRQNVVAYDSTDELGLSVHRLRQLDGSSRGSVQPYGHIHEGSAATVGASIDEAT